MMHTMPKRLGCDIGGTFTDFVVLDDATGEIALEKVLTTPSEPSVGIFNGIEQLTSRDANLLREASTVVHGTTLVINALIERKGSPTALITTKGFRDVLEMRTELRYDVFDLQIEFPAPLIPRHLRFEVPERLTADGEVLHALDLRTLPSILETLRRHDVTTVAVVLLHSYVNAAHEKTIAAWFSQHAPDIVLSLSSDVLPRIKEYERTSTTVANAYVKPKVQSYIGLIEDGLAKRDFGGDFYIMQSSAGVIESGVAKSLPIRIIESGPAAGVAASIWWAKFCGIGDILSFDMGGTTAKLCAVVDGEALVTDEYEAARLHHFKRGSGLAVNVPVLDLLEIGTGGGSIAHIDRLGLLKVGPRSAGADPGPACYGRGGTRPPVTDCDLLLGYLDAGSFLGGAMALDAQAARRVVESLPLDMSLDDAAYGIHDVANEDMAGAARLHLAERGQNPAGLTMVAYGGAGPVHAYGLASKLGIQRIIIPPAAGVMSALGMLVANVAIDRVRTFKAFVSSVEIAALDNAFAELEREALDLLPADTINRVAIRRIGEFRYAKQGYNVTVFLPNRQDWGGVDAKTLQTAFDDVYKGLYGRLYDDVATEIVNLRVVAEVIPESAFKPKALPVSATSSAEEAARGHRSMFLPGQGFREVPVYDRYRLKSGHRLSGPAIIEERETTTIVGADAELAVDKFGALIITLGDTA